MENDLCCQYGGSHLGSDLMDNTPQHKTSKLKNETSSCFSMCGILLSLC